MDPFEFARIAAGMLPREDETGSNDEPAQRGIPQKVSGIAEADSAGGYVSIDLGGSSVTEGDLQAVEMPTDIPVKAGDEVSVEIVDGKPRVVGRIGWGDELQGVADEALAVAQATGQHFWHDDAGAHVSTEALNPTGASNSLWNSLGLLIRKAANNLVSITQSAIAFYDGNGNNSSNITAQFGSSGATIGKAAENNVSISSSGVDVVASDVTGVVNRIVAAFGRRLLGIYNLQPIYESALRLADSEDRLYIDISTGGTLPDGSYKPITIDTGIGMEITTNGSPTAKVYIEDGSIYSAALHADGQVSGQSGSFENLYLANPLTIANGGTEATNAADARANLLAVGYQSGMNAAIANFTGADQMWGLRAKVINTNNTDYLDHSVYILLRNDGLSAYDTTASTYPWRLKIPTDVVTDLTVNVGDVSITNATATKFQTRRQGSVVNLVVYQLKVSASLADGSSISLGSGIIGSNARPSTYIFMPLMANVSGKGSGCFLYVTPAGNVTLYNRSGSALGTGTNLAGNTSWVV